MPIQDPTNGFAGDTAVFTSWGPCRLHDLARLSVRRDDAAERWTLRLAEQEASNDATLAAFDADIAPQLSDAEATVQRDALIADMSAALVTLGDARDADLAVRMPLVYVDADTTAECTGVLLVGEANAVADVTIAQVGEPAVDVVVRCGGSAAFVTDNGDVLAANVDGETLHLHTGATFIASMAVVMLDDPIALYHVECVAGTCCVGADSTVAAYVRTL